MEGDRDDPRAFGHPLPRAEVERHAGPAPVVDLAPERHEGLGLRVGSHTRFVEVADVLPADHLGGVDRLHRPEHLVLLLADGLRSKLGGRLHRHEPEDLEEVGHHHVAVRADRLVERDALSDRQRLGDVDLHVGDVIAVPDRLEQAVGEPEGQDVQRRFLAEEVVDPEDLVLVEGRVQHVVEAHRALEVGAERLLHHDPGALGQVGLGEQLDHVGCGYRGDAQVVQAGRVAPQLTLERLDAVRERGGVGRLGDERQP